MEKSERDIYVTHIEEFVKRNKKGRLKADIEIINYLNRLFGCIELQRINHHGDFERLTYRKEHSLINLFNGFQVIIYFPYEGLRLYCSLKEASKIPYINTILNSEFRDKPITFKCIKNKCEIHNSPKIIISIADSDSIILENDKTLKNSLARY